MSKSLGNFYTLEDVTKKGFNPLAVRYLFATAHYRQRLNFTWEALEGAQRSLDRLYENMAMLSPMTRINLVSEGEWHEKFVRAISDDLNMPQAIAVVWEMLKSNIGEATKYSLLLDWDRVLGLRLDEGRKEEKVSKVSKEIENLVKEREELRREGKWDEADKIRRRVEEKGYIIEDTKEGPRIEIVRG